MIKTKLVSVSSLVCLTIIIFQGCTDKYPHKIHPAREIISTGCTDCHMNAELLKRVATPLPPPAQDAGAG